MGGYLQAPELKAVDQERWKISSNIRLSIMENDESCWLCIPPSLGHCMSTPGQRKTLRQYHQATERVYDEYQAAEKAYQAAFEVWRNSPMGTPQPRRPALGTLPEFPPECEDMICGAKTRQGHPCRNTDLYPNGRCKFHGGASTGPLSDQGKRRASLNGLIKKRTPWRPDKTFDNSKST